MSYLDKHKASELKVGDKVKIIRTAISYEQGWNTSWCPGMDNMVGKIYTIITDINTNGFQFTIGGYAFPYFVLEKERPKYITFPKIIADRIYPHICPYCGASAYIGFSKVECSKDCQNN